MKFLLIAICSLLIISCEPTKFVQKNTFVYKYKLGTSLAGSPVDSFYRYKVQKEKEVEITDNGNYLVIKDDPATDLSAYKLIGSGTISKSEMPVWKTELGNKSYFNEGSDNNGRKSFWYRDRKFVLQPATIPVKIRSSVREPAYKDSFPSQVETGVNVGFLIGGKQTWNRYRTSSNILGQKTDKYSITAGVLLSAGSVDLSTSTTRPKIDFPRKAAMFSFGGAIVLGLNSVNLGYAFGWDKPFGTGASNWIYKGKMWNGIIVSLDLIK